MSHLRDGERGGERGRKRGGRRERERNREKESLLNIVPQRGYVAISGCGA